MSWPDETKEPAPEVIVHALREIAAHIFPRLAAGEAASANPPMIDGSVLRFLKPIEPNRRTTGEMHTRKDIHLVFGLVVVLAMAILLFHHLPA